MTERLFEPESTTKADEPMKRSAVFSVGSRYRYRLERRWGHDPRSVTWIMLNPSTADGLDDDPTIRRCIAFTRSWGYDALVVVNLFAYRSTDPKALGAESDPVGPDNRRHVAAAVAESDVVVAAWGANARKVPAFPLAPNPRDYTARLSCLGTTKDGSPRHPLYVAGTTPLVPWTGC